MAFVLFIWSSFQKPQRTEENGENYSFGPQTEAKCQVSSMVKQGQLSPVVSLPFRLYWQLCDPTVWITIISQSPCCVPPVTQTYSQTKNTQLLHRNPHHKSRCKNKQLYLVENRTTHMNSPLLHSCVRLWLQHHCLLFAPFCAQSNRTLAGKRIHVCCKIDIEKRHAILALVEYCSFQWGNV